MSTDFRALDRAAFQRGMADYERGVARSENPHRYNAATSEREEWLAGWDSAEELEAQDKTSISKSTGS
jgi:ribosome modulation factor